MKLRQKLGYTAGLSFWLAVYNGRLMKKLQELTRIWQTAFEEGMRARLKGLHIEDCPYKNPFSTRVDGWKKGFTRKNSMIIKEASGNGSNHFSHRL